MTQLKEEFQKQGFVIIPKALEPSLVQQLIEATDRTLNNEKFSYDLLKINKSQHIHKAKYMFEKEEIFLKTLVHDSLLSVVLEFIDDPQMVVPTWEDMLIKIPNEGIPVNVHQDLALQSVKSNVFSLAIYLHDSHHNPVYYLPESHNMGHLTRDALYEVYHKYKDDFVPLNVKAGDITVHNVKTVHYSDENITPYPRYTWYLEFRTVEQLLNDSPWDAEWINRRRAIWVSALKNYKNGIDELIPDYEDLKEYMNPLQLRISHTNEKVQYDMESPYNHFI
ncbi:MAG: phytanoyl-CoA dioxygenase family protein [Alphaproteobacteria bacterium]|nr:phytanoyl-CoA dioxygenase family protein [Alphaproteobacteria bacterium]